MQTNVEMLGELQRRAHMSVAVEQIEGEILKRLSRLARTAKIAGFRPGKVPMKMIAQQYGPQVRMEVLNDAVNETFVSLVQQENLRVAGYPQIEPRQDSTDQTKLEYTATFEVYPDVVIGDLSGIRIEKPIAEVTPADVERTIDILRKQKVSFEPVTRPAGKGDRVIVDFTGTIDGVEFPGGQAKDLAITVGEGRMLPEFEAALAGVVAGDNKAFELTFPQDYHGKEVAGKTAVFSMNVKSVAEPNLPPVDAAFARGYGVADGNLDKLHEEIGANLKLELKRRIIARMRDQVMDALRKSTPIAVPQALVEMDIQRQMQQAAAELKSRGVEPTSEQLRPEMFREAAASRVALGLLIGELVRQNGLDAKPEQVRALVEESAQSYEQPEEVVKWHFQDRTRLGDFEAQALEQNVIDWVLARSQVAELQTTFAELTGVAG
ncbi:MAG: trigger factor [Betaproteobacteria bacterium]|nr:trigger factor [Betaproteobacteria bacterium]